MRPSGRDVEIAADAGTDIGTASNPKPDGAISGTFNLAGTALLSEFNDLDASGEWRLSIVDSNTNDFGTLFGWNLVVGY